VAFVGLSLVVEEGKYPPPSRGAPWDGHKRAKSPRHAGEPGTLEICNASARWPAIMPGSGFRFCHGE